MRGRNRKIAGRKQKEYKEKLLTLSKAGGGVVKDIALVNEKETKQKKHP